MPLRAPPRLYLYAYLLSLESRFINVMIDKTSVSSCNITITTFTAFSTSNLGTTFTSAKKFSTLSLMLSSSLSTTRKIDSKIFHILLQDNYITLLLSLPLHQYTQYEEYLLTPLFYKMFPLHQLAYAVCPCRGDKSYVAPMSFLLLQK